MRTRPQSTIRRAIMRITFVAGLVTLKLLFELAILAQPNYPISPFFLNPSNDHLYCLLNESTWIQAEAGAVRLGGHLVTIRSGAENNWIASTFGTNGGVIRCLWIGLYDP